MFSHLDEPFDPYDDDAREDAAMDAHLDAVLTEYDAARRALATIRDDGSLGPIERWSIFDRYAKARVAMEAEKDRASYGAINDAVVAQTLAEVRRG
jgi:hypothetical protein